MSNDEPKVGYVLKRYPRPSETFIIEEILSIEKESVPVEVFSLRTPEDGRFHEKTGAVKARVHYVPRWKPSKFWAWACGHVDWIESRGAGIGRAALRLMRQPAAAIWGSDLLSQVVLMAEMVERAGVRHLHAHFATIATEVAALVHLITGASFSFTSHAKDIYRSTVDAKRFAELVSMASRVFTVCEANRRYILEHLAPGQAHKIEVMYNGVDLESFKPVDPVSSKCILAIGRMVEKKGFHHLVDACALLRDQGVEFECQLIGDGEERPRLEAAVRSHGLERHVVLQGVLSQGDVASLLPRARLLCQPSVIGADGNRDALPTVILEAMACGVPVVATPIGGIEEMVENGREGLLAPPADAVSLAKALRHLLEDDEFHRSARRAARLRVERMFDTSERGRRLSQRFRELLSQDRTEAGATRKPVTRAVGGSV